MLDCLPTMGLKQRVNQLRACPQNILFDVIARDADCVWDKLRVAVLWLQIRVHRETHPGSCSPTAPLGMAACKSRILGWWLAIAAGVLFQVLFLISCSVPFILRFYRKYSSLLLLLSDPNFKQQVRKPTILGWDKHTKLLYFNYSNNLKQF